MTTDQASNNKPASEAITEPQDRTVVFHYHLFKNAGTSLDAALREAFGDDAWAEREFRGPISANQKATAEWIETHPEIQCFSSHTSVLPCADIPGVTVFPVILLRHPIDRIASAYTFEAQQNAGTFGSTLARNTTLAGYIETRLSMPGDHQCSEFHAYRLAEGRPASEGSLHDRALQVLEQLPFIGIVEEYGRSLSILESALTDAGFENVALQNQQKNVSKGRKRLLDDKLQKIRSEIGDELFDRLIEANRTDLELHTQATMALT